MENKTVFGTILDFIKNIHNRQANQAMVSQLATPEELIYFFELTLTLKGLDVFKKSATKNIALTQDLIISAMLVMMNKEKNQALVDLGNKFYQVVSKRKNEKQDKLKFFNS